MRRFRPRTPAFAIAGTGTFGGLLSLALILLAVTPLALAAIALTTIVVAAEYVAWNDTFTRDG